MVRSSNSSTRRSSDSRSGVQYAVDVEESMVDDTGAEIRRAEERRQVDVAW